MRGLLLAILPLALWLGASPEILATGVQYLLVNGQLAVDKGKLTSTLAGRALKH